MAKNPTPARAKALNAAGDAMVCAIPGCGSIPPCPSCKARQAKNAKTAQSTSKREQEWAVYITGRLCPIRSAQAESERRGYRLFMSDNWFAEHEPAWEVDFANKVLLSPREEPREVVRGWLWFYVHERQNPHPRTDHKSERRAHAKRAKNIRDLLKDITRKDHDGSRLMHEIHLPNAQDLPDDVYLNPDYYDPFYEVRERHFIAGLKGMLEYSEWVASEKTPKSEHVPGREDLISRLAHVYSAAGGRLSVGAGDEPTPFSTFCLDVAGKIPDTRLKEETLSGLERKVKRVTSGRLKLWRDFEELNRDLFKVHRFAKSR